jgi:hypothetical protein
MSEDGILQGSIPCRFTSAVTNHHDNDYQNTYSIHRFVATKCSDEFARFWGTLIPKSGLTIEPLNV